MPKGRSETLTVKIQEFRKICKEAGIRVTPQRLALFREIVRAKDHPSAEDLHKRVRPKIPTISLDTVYRTLATFESYGFLTKLIVFEDRIRFDPNTFHHHHLICTECRSVEDLLWPTFEKLKLPSRAMGWGNVNDRQAQLTGLCGKCQRKRRE